MAQVGVTLSKRSQHAVTLRITTLDACLDPADFAGLVRNRTPMPIGHFSYTVVNTYYFNMKLISHQAKNSR